MARHPAPVRKTETDPKPKSEKKPRPHPPKYMDWASL